jgi:hypothetical protein
MAVIAKHDGFTATGYVIFSASKIVTLKVDVIEGPRQYSQVGRDSENLYPARMPVGQSGQLDVVILV